MKWRAVPHYTAALTLDSIPPSPPGVQETPQFDRPTGSVPAFDLTIQSCTVELFHTMGVALAPLARSASLVATCEHFERIGIVAFSSPRANGTLMLSMDDGVYGILVPPVVSDARKNDVLRELTNQLIGRIKNRLIQFEVTLRVGLPTVKRKQLLGQRTSTAPSVCYRFRTLRGGIMVTLEGGIYNEPLNYSSRVRVAKEGDFIVF